MTFTFSEKQIGSSSTNSSTIAAAALSSAVTTSQFVVGGVTFSSESTATAISSVKDEKNNVYSLVGSAVLSTAGGTYVQLYYLDAPPSSPTTITATLNGTANLRAIYVGVFNRGAAVSIDKNSTNTGSGTAISVASFTPTGANELIVSACAEDAGTTLTAGTNGGTYTILEQDTLQIGGSEYLIQTTATATTANFTTTGSATWAEAAAAFQEASGSVFIPPRRLVKTYDLIANIKH